jgi:phosphopantetheinyl transferase
MGENGSDNGDPAMTGNVEKDVYILRLERDTGCFEAFLSFVSAQSLKPDDLTHLTGKDDNKHYNELINPEKRKEFLAGRKAIKKALETMGFSDSDDIEVHRGVFGYPLLKGLVKDLPEVSVAHSSGLAAVLVFPAGQQMALDLEIIRVDRVSRIKAIRSVLTVDELRRIDDDQDMAAIPLYTLWSQKEALSKALKCGLTIPFPLLETMDPVYHGDWSEVHFRNFFQYRAITVLPGRNYALSLAMPRKTRINNIKEIAAI